MCRDRLFVFTGIYIVYAATSVLWGVNGDPLVFADHLRRGVLLALFLSVLAVLTREIRQFQDHVSWTVGFAGALGGIAAAVSFYTEFPLTKRLPPVLGSDDIIHGATMLGVSAVMLLALSLNVARPVCQRLVAAVLYSIVLVVIILSQSRGVFLGLLVAMGVLLLCSHRRQAISALGLLAVPLLVLLAFPVDVMSYLERMDAGRFDIWSTSVSLAAERPVFGYGIDHGITLGQVDGVDIVDAHNVYLTALIDGGLVLFLLVAGLSLWSLATSVQRFREHGDAWLMALVAFGLTNSVFHFGKLVQNASTVWLFFWLPVGIAIGYRLRERYGL